MFKNIPFNRVEWVTSIFLISTAILTCTAVPWYFLTYGWNWFLFGLFIFFYLATGMSITVGYHRLFSHKAFKAKWPVKLFVLLFGAAAFENAALWWSAEHRKHHKHVDTDEDPYDINKVFLGPHGVVNVQIKTRKIFFVAEVSSVSTCLWCLVFDTPPKCAHFKSNVFR